MARAGDERATYRPRRAPGVELTLRVTVPEGEDGEKEAVRRAIVAWILFGGYGSRTRRGCGCLTVLDKREAKEWLPERVDMAAIRRLIGPAAFAEAKSAPRDMPLLEGAELFTAPERSAEEAWRAALGWLRDFRQGMPTSSREPKEKYARAYPAKPPMRRAGRSNWPEPDKVRRLAGDGPWAHDPRPEHGSEPAWPRASFGLPIISRFQTKDREQRDYNPKDPPGFTLYWKDGTDKHDRLGSPLIVKPMPLADGRFVPIALWLFRAYPEGGRVYLEKPAVQGSSEAPFDRLVAPGDKAPFEPLREKTMREAFLGWLAKRNLAKKL
jgi:CRISPR-associated protein Cmr1